MLSEKKILNETKNHNPPFQVKWSVPYIILTDLTCYFLYSHETNLDNYQVMLVKLSAGINNLLSDISPQQFIDKFFYFNRLLSQLCCSFLGYFIYAKFAVMSLKVCPSIRLFRIMSIPTTFRLFCVLTSEVLGRRLPVITLLLWQRQYFIVVDAVDYK